jgi:hypothetical protein
MILNPFTARSGIDPRVFVGREDELAFFKQRLARSIEGNCQHYVITGTWGIGKTALLRQMKLLAQAKGAWGLSFCIRRFSPHEGQSDFARHVLQMAADELPVQIDKHGAKQLQALGVTALSFGINAQWGDKKTSEEPDPHLRLRDGLIGLHSLAVEHDAKALVLLIDDIQNLDSDGRELTLLRNVLADTKVIGKLNILVILSSIEQGWNPFLVRDHPVGRLFMPKRSLPHFDETQTMELIEGCLHGTGVEFDEVVKKRVHDITQGHVFEVQALCESLFDQQVKGKVTADNWETALRHTLLNLASAQFDSMANVASEQELAALQILARSDTPLGPQAVKNANQRIKSTAQVLKRLSEKGLTERFARGKYGIADRLFAEYVNRKQNK